MRVLLVKPYEPRVSLVCAPPLGPLLLASALRRRFGSDLEVDVLDMAARGLRPEWLAGWIERVRPDVVGVSALNCMAPAARRIARLVKEALPGVLTVLGGPHAHRRVGELLERTEYDWVVDGEAERVFPEALARHFAGEPFRTDLPGLGYRIPGDGVHVPGSTDLIPDLDTVDYPAWDLVDFDLYARLPSTNNVLIGRRYAHLFTSRGCPYRCIYCHDIFGKKFRCRSAQNVLGEIELLHERHGVDEFQVMDDIFNLDKPRLKEIMAGVVRRWPGKLKFCFPNALRSDILDDSVLDALKAGGTYSLAISIETASPRFQKLIQKDLDIEKAKWAIDAADRRGMIVRGAFMVGFPGETREELQQTIDLAVRSRLSVAQFLMVTPHPGTALHDWAAKENPSALEGLDESSDYRHGRSWYERAYGFPLRRFVQKANLRFYLSPRRLARLASRLPVRAWPVVAGRFLLTVLDLAPAIKPAPPPLPPPLTKGIEDRGSARPAA